MSELAKTIINIELARAKPLLWYLNVPASTFSSDDEELGTNPFMACCFYNDLSSVNILVYTDELIKQFDLFGADDFAKRVRSGLYEEVIHAVQIQHVQSEFALLSDAEKKAHPDAFTYYRQRQTELLREMSAVPEAHDLLVSAGRLYYEDRSLTDVDRLKEIEQVVNKKFEGYVMVELARQIIEYRQLGQISEQGRSKGWDPARRFGDNPVATVNTLAGVIARDQEKVLALCPQMRHFVEATEKLLNTIPVRMALEDSPLTFGKTEQPHLDLTQPVEPEMAIF